MMPRLASRSIHSQKVLPGGTSSNVCWALGTGSASGGIGDDLGELAARDDCSGG